MAKASSTRATLVWTGDVAAGLYEAKPVMDVWTMGLDGWLWMGAWILALLIVVWLLVRDHSTVADRDRPLDVLRSRLARGEISPEEFERARRLLES